MFTNLDSMVEQVTPIVGRFQRFMQSEISQSQQPHTSTGWVWKLALSSLLREKERQVPNRRQQRKAAVEHLAVKIEDSRQAVQMTWQTF
jgi:hypothetical protein